MQLAKTIEEKYGCSIIYERKKFKGAEYIDADSPVFIKKGKKINIPKAELQTLILESVINL